MPLKKKDLAAAPRKGGGGAGAGEGRSGETAVG